MSLYATELGTSGPTIVFLHGLFGQGKNWTSVAKALSPQARSILVDLPNHGRSPWTEHFSYQAIAESVAELLEARSTTSYAVVGHSMGGKVAMALALLRPDLVEQLCVVDVSPAPHAQLSSFGAYVAGMRSIDLGQLTSRGAADLALTDAVPDLTIRSFLLQNLRRDPSAQPPWRWQMNLRLLGDELTAIGGWPELNASPYPGPVLWLAGERSDYVQPAYMPAMRALFPRVRLVRVKDAAHWVHSDQPGVFVSALGQFLHLAAGPGGKVGT